MLEKEMQTIWKILQNETQTGAKIENKSIKTEVQESMRKKDAPHPPGRMSFAWGGRPF